MTCLGYESEGLGILFTLLSRLPSLCFLRLDFKASSLNTERSEVILPEEYVVVRLYFVTVSSFVDKV